jgi:hypothetical protein
LISGSFNISTYFKLLETKLNKVTSEIEKINHNLDKTCQTLDKTVSAEFGIAESLSLSEFCCNCSFKLSSASDSGEKRLDVSMSNSDDSLYLFRVPSLSACEFL